MNILIRNLSRDTNEVELKRLFEPFGKIASLNIVVDGATGESKGFGFADMPNKEDAVAAIKQLNGTVLKGEKIRVKVTKRSSTATKDKMARRYKNYKSNSSSKGLRQIKRPK